MSDQDTTATVTTAEEPIDGATIDLEELIKAASHAPPGPWTTRYYGGRDWEGNPISPAEHYVIDAKGEIVADWDEQYGDRGIQPHTMDFMEKANPAVVTALVRRLKAVEAKIERIGELPAALDSWKRAPYSDYRVGFNDGLGSASDALRGALKSDT